MSSFIILHDPYFNYLKRVKYSLHDWDECKAPQVIYLNVFHILLCHSLI